MCIRDRVDGGKAQRAPQPPAVAHGEGDLIGLPQQCFGQGDVAGRKRGADAGGGHGRALIQAGGHHVRPDAPGPAQLRQQGSVSRLVYAEGEVPAAEHLPCRQPSHKEFIHERLRGQGAELLKGRAEDGLALSLIHI